ncbi:MAG: potassium transporter TrkG, partial [Gammaproteobacteria bacterium]
MLIKTIFHVLGLLLLIFSLTFLPPMIVSYIYHDGTIPVLFLSSACSFSVGLILWFPFRGRQSNLRAHDAFIIVVLLWVIACLFGSLPFYFLEAVDIAFVDAFFETVSGITTTGSTALVNLEQLPLSILYYRQQLQFLGGIGIIVMAVAILPILGIGGLQLLRAEISGPIQDTKLTPRIAQTAKALLSIYLCLTVAC